MQALMKEFRTFLLRGNLVDMAVGIVIGIAFAASVQSSPVTRSTAKRRLCGQVLALACNFIRIPPWSWWLGSSSLQGDPDGTTLSGTTPSAR